MDIFYSYIGDGLADFFSVDNTHTALKIFATMFAVSFLGAVVYYRLIDSAALNKTKHWAVPMIVAVVISGVCGYLLIDSGVSNYLYDNAATSIVVSDEDKVLTSVVNMVYSIIVYILSSIVFKRFSHNCSVTPF